MVYNAQVSFSLFSHLYTLAAAHANAHTQTLEKSILNGIPLACMCTFYSFSVVVAKIIVIQMNEMT